MLNGKQPTYKRNIETRSYNFCYRGKEISITHAECVFVALGCLHAMRMRQIVICGLPLLYNIFPRCFKKGTILGWSGGGNY